MIGRLVVASLRAALRPLLLGVEGFQRRLEMPLPPSVIVERRRGRPARRGGDVTATQLSIDFDAIPEADHEHELVAA